MDTPITADPAALDPTAPADFILDGVTVDVAVREQDGSFHGYVYLATNLVFTLVEPTGRTPAGIEDFAAVTLRAFSRRLAALLQPEA